MVGVGVLIDVGVGVCVGVGVGSGVPPDKVVPEKGDVRVRWLNDQSYSNTW